MASSFNTEGSTESGAPGLGALPWGTHLCHFYASAADLADTLVPFFEAGLERNEACLWVSASPPDTAKARARLAAVVPDLRKLEERGQLEVIAHDEWYLRNGRPDAASTLRAGVEREERALAEGYDGLRLTGDTCWLQRADWTGFMEYEALVTGAFSSRRIVALCSYCLDRCSASDVLDVVRTHQLSVARRSGAWQVVESAQLQKAHEDRLRVGGASASPGETDCGKDQLIAIVGHELRNPLAPIRSAVEIMRLRHAGGTFDRELGIIERQVHHMTKLVDDLLDAASLNRDLEIQRGPVDARDLVADAVEIVREAATSKRQTLSLKTEPGLVIDGDMRRLVQVVGNLLGNATKHSRAGGAVRVEANRSGSFCEIRVEDDGPGIAPELLPRIFEPFVQGSQGFDRGRGGLGIGLTLVRRIVELHGGTVTVQSAVGGGSAFVVRIPIWRREAEQAPALQRSVRSTAPRRVLVVDDNEDAAVMLAELLQLLGHEALIARHPRQALSLADRRPIDVAVVDLGLPEMDGYSLARALQERQPGVVIVAVSGYAQEEDRARSAALGFAAHLAKPVDASKIADVIARV